MFNSITFSVGKKTITLYGQEFILGELSVQIMNMWSCQLGLVRKRMAEGRELSEQYKDTQDYSYWYQANDSYLLAESILLQHPILCLLQRKSSVLWNTTVLEHRDWHDYKEYFQQLWEIWNDIVMFRKVIGFFTENYITPLKNIEADILSDAVERLNRDYYRMCYPEEEKIVFFPYPNTPIILDFEVGISDSKSRSFQVLEKYTAENLMMLLKIDFYKALSAGHLIRQCEYCGRFFLLTKRLHTKYCDNPAPDNPKFTCAQMGYQRSRKKEQPEDDPKADSLRRCLNRITQDCSRNIITPEERDLLKAKANELYHEAKIRSGVTYEEFEKSLASRNLYPLCNVVKKSNPVGRPKTEKAG